jgi:hypothetical protein
MLAMCNLCDKNGTFFDSFPFHYVSYFSGTYLSATDGAALIANFQQASIELCGGQMTL